MSSDQTHRPTVSFIGVGNMGLGMVGRLRDRGWPVAVCDIDPAACERAAALGARVWASPLALAQAMPADGLLIVVVVDALQCEDILWGTQAWPGQGAAQAMHPGQTVMWCPTIGPDDTESLSARLALQGIDALDAPISGGPARARAGTMSLMLAGADEVVLRHQTVLANLANPLFRIGQRLGDGARTKLVNNLLAGINLVGAAEALALAQRLGLDAGRTLDVIEQSSGQSWIGSDRLRRALASDTDPRAHMSLLTKDTGLAMATARTAGFDGPLGAAAAATFRQACEAGLRDADDGALYGWLVKRSETG